MDDPNILKCSDCGETHWTEADAIECDRRLGKESPGVIHVVVGEADRG